MNKHFEAEPEHVQTRRHVFQTAVASFRRLGYYAVALPDIAAEAGLPIEAVQSHFSSKEAIALALFQLKVDELVRHIDSLPAGALADRFSQALSFTLQTMTEDREAVVALFARAMADGAEFDIMSGSFAECLTAAMQRLVLESGDALRDQQARDMGVALYTVMMLVLIYWCYDRSPEQEASGNLLGLVRDLFAQVRQLYFLPMAPQAIARLAGIVQPLSKSASVGAAAQKDARDSEHQDLDIHRD